MSTALSLGATYIARSFSGDKEQLVPLIKGALMHQGSRWSTSSARASHSMITRARPRAMRTRESSTITSQTSTTFTPSEEITRVL